MAYIYKIVNTVNDKIYIGKTDFSLDKRFKEHCRDSRKETYEKRPLYIAMRKYGIENFNIELIEETLNPDEREIYWIELLQSFKYGYNATKGGDSTHYADYDIIYSLYQEDFLQRDIQKITGYADKTIYRALASYEITSEERKRRANKAMSKPIARLDKKTGEILEVFSSVSEAERKYNLHNHISQVCLGKRKSSGGYGWKYIHLPPI